MKLRRVSDTIALDPESVDYVQDDSTQSRIVTAITLKATGAQVTATVIRVLVKFDDVLNLLSGDASWWSVQKRMEIEKARAEREKTPQDAPQDKYRV